MQTLSEIRQLLAERGLKPKHRLGQNFLHDKNQLAKLVDAAQVRPGDVVLEVGPGTGTLTEELLARGAQVIACELDGDMASLIEERFAAAIRAGRPGNADADADADADGGRGILPLQITQPRGRMPLPPVTGGGTLTLIRGDCLAKGGGRSLNPAVIEAIGGRAFKLVANLPYQAASPLMSALLVDHPECIGQFVTIQREVADRLLAKPGSKEYGTLGIVIQSMARVEKLATLAPGCFWPPPEVTSAMVAIVPRGSEDAVAGGPAGENVGGTEGGNVGGSVGGNVGGNVGGSEERREFARFVTGLFTKRRKQIGGIVGRGRAIAWPLGITPDQRPEALTVGQLIALWRVVEAASSA